MLPVTISRMTRTDLEQVLAIEQASFTTPWLHESFEFELKHKPAYDLCARRDGAVLGYLMGWDLPPEFHLGNLAVRADRRRQGIAAGLLEHLLAEKEAAHYTLVTLEVREHNTAAIRLYARFGFRPVAIRKQYYHDTREDAIIMVRYFSAAKGPLPQDTTHSRPLSLSAADRTKE
jgi:ribosomal-protein-alanine N-acetyltransferase